MQSDLNSFGGDVVLDSFNMAYREEEINLDQIFQIKHFGFFIMKMKMYVQGGKPEIS